MSKLKGWSNNEVIEEQDIGTLIDDELINFDLYRLVGGISDDNPFRKTQSARNYERIRTIRGRLDRRDAIYKTQSGDVSKSVDHLFIATVYYKGLKIGDVLKYNDQDYVVKFINKVGQSYSEAEVEITV